jgi:hypothetical protein
MKTMLNHGSLDKFTPAQRHVMRHAEIVAHDAALSIYQEVRAAFPEEIRDRALAVTLIGLASAFGRLLATVNDQGHAARVLRGLSDMMPGEVEYWRGARKPN